MRFRQVRQFRKSRRECGLGCRADLSGFDSEVRKQLTERQNGWWRAGRHEQWENFCQIVRVPAKCLKGNLQLFAAHPTPMSELNPPPNANLLLERLKKQPELAGTSEAILAAVAFELAKSGKPVDAAMEDAARQEVRKRAGGTETASAAGPADSLGTIVNRRFEGATQDITGRHQVVVREERLRRLVAGVLEGLGGRGATLTDLLQGAGRAVTDSVVQGLGGVPVSEIERRILALRGQPATASELDAIVALLRARPATSPLDGPSTAQLAYAVSQAVQQVAANVQKIVTVALDAERTADQENPKYSSP